MFSHMPQHSLSAGFTPKQLKNFRVLKKNLAIERLLKVYL